MYHYIVIYIHIFIYRYGKGLVIYWHGYVDTIITHIHNRYNTTNTNTTNTSTSIYDTDNKCMLYVTNDLPDVWLYPTGEVATCIR